MNRYFLIIGIIIILLNKNVTIDKKALYLGVFILSMKYLKRNKDIIDKTFFIDLKTNQLFTNLLGETIRSILLSRDWKELDSEDLKSINKIGLVFSNTNSKNILKSQINYRVYTQNSEIFTNKIYFSENFKDTQFFPKYSVLDRLSIIHNIDKLYKLISTLKKNKNIFFCFKRSLWVFR